MGLKPYLKYFLLTVLLKYSQGCTPFRAKNLGSINSTFLSSLIEPFKSQIPVFNESTVPNFDSIVEEYNSGMNNEDIHLNITQILRRHGYGAELHQVKTSDGYLLDIFRIPGNRSAVLIWHGILSSSDDYVSTGPEIGLPYLLADLGYDVWMGNARGNVHGRRHVTLSPDCAEFWQFSWDEIGRKDLPATIDYILDKTNQQKLAYIGHSQGTTTFFVMASEIPEYNEKISVMIALSSVTYLSHTQNPLLQIIAKITGLANVLTQAIGLYEFSPRNQITDAFTSIACGTPWSATIFCNNLAFLLLGADYGQINARILPAFYGHYPAGASTKQLVHFGQLINSGRFCQYNHGVFGNIDKYGTSEPPEYPLEKITSKVAVFYADNDNYFSAPLDREKLLARLPNIITKYRVPYAAFAHMDFLFAKDVRKLAYNKVVEILSENV